VNHEYALTFPTGKFTEPQRWQRGPYVLELVPKKAGHFRSGYWLLYVPEEKIVAGKAVQLRVAHVSGLRHSFFMIKGRDDTVAHERLSLEGVAGGLDTKVGTAAKQSPPASSAGSAPSTAKRNDDA
jgi:hypothetical protein